MNATTVICLFKLLSDAEGGIRIKWSLAPLKETEPEKSPVPHFGLGVFAGTIAPSLPSPEESLITSPVPSANFQCAIKPPPTVLSSAEQGSTIANAITKRSVPRTGLQNLSLMACLNIQPTYPAVATGQAATPPRSAMNSHRVIQRASIMSVLPERTVAVPYIHYVSEADIQPHWDENCPKNDYQLRSAPCLYYLA